MSLPPDLPQHIRTFLTGTEVDLQTVSAKQIRTKLATIFPDLDVRGRRSEIDEISIPIFHEIKERAEAVARAAERQASVKSLGSVNLSQANKPSASLPSRGIPAVATSENATPLPKNPNPPPSTNVHSTSHQQDPKPASGKIKKRKSAAYVDTDDEDRPNGGSGVNKRKPKKPKTIRTPRPEGEGGASSNKGIHVELNCSPPLAELIGVPMCSRPQVVKKLWEYIKRKGLQDPLDKRQIICDDAMKQVFNQNSVNMFAMNVRDFFLNSKNIRESSLQI